MTRSRNYLDVNSFYESYSLPNLLEKNSGYILVAMWQPHPCWPVVHRGKREHASRNAFPMLARPQSGCLPAGFLRAVQTSRPRNKAAQSLRPRAE